MKVLDLQSMRRSIYSYPDGYNQYFPAHLEVTNLLTELIVRTMHPTIPNLYTYLNLDAQKWDTEGLSTND